MPAADPAPATESTAQRGVEDPLPGDRRTWSTVSGWCAGVSDSTGFGVAAFVLIVANAAVLGVETYPGTARAWHIELRVAETFFLVAFTAELAIRMAAFGRHPGRFFRDGWNVFDFIVVVAAFVPVVRENATILRLLRLARVLRAVRMFPQVRVIIHAAWKSLPGALSFLVVGALVLYIYAMLGWMLFADELPDHYGSLGRACLTLFFLMALDGLGDMVREGLEVSRWTALYFGSYVLVSSFLLVNLLIGVVITSLEDARASERPQPTPQASEPEEIRRRVAEVRTALEALEAAMESSGPGRRTPPEVPRDTRRPMPPTDRHRTD
ncbi:MAG TPA: ion transporter [Yinghuangia sp.]|uniref:ion transporter n=1 Tax=Yinghuangia sp. YIM S10712 TaxID=3436930 RepID=UPI002BA8523E|nr:ion transporter [Yinghuangia sp.]